MCGEICLCTFVRFVRYVITTIRACYALLRSRSALCLYGFCRMALQLLGTLERRRGALCPFAFLLTMEKLQLYSPRRLCYNSLVLGVSRCTGQEISACREASLGRSKLGRSKLGKKEWKGGSMPFAQLMAVLPLRDTLLAYWISGRRRWFVWCLWTEFPRRKWLPALAWPTAPSTGSSVLPSKTLRRCMPIPISFASDFENVLKMSELMYLKCHMALWYD